MASKTSQIICPNCSANIDVNDILKHQIEDELRKELTNERTDFLKIQKKEVEQFQKEKAVFEAKKKRENELFEERLNKFKKQEEKKLEVSLKHRLEQENKERIAAMENELKEKSERVKELHKKEAEIEKLKREKEEAAELAKLEVQRTLNEKLNEEKIKIKRLAEQENELKLKEFEKKLDEQKKLTEEMKRKQEQGSMQMQGEVMELVIESWLISQFPLDNIEKIKKGIHGADCIQIVNTRTHSNCGTIYYESKRTKTFQAAWIEKFKNDIRDKGATLGVLVTEVMPNDMDRMGLKDGVWVCTYEEFKGLCSVLRQSIIQWHQTKQSQENKEGKMELLYNFLTSNEFYLQMEGIVDGFTKMQSDLQKEKNAMARLWKQREKHLNMVVANAINMHASFKGIAGNVIQSIPALEIDSDIVKLEE
ncbi:MAG: DUF2130 domain-containing protein [Tenacibaculum sp.]